MANRTELQALSARVANRYLRALDPNSVLSSSARQKVNAALDRAGFGGNKRFRNASQALGEIAETLRDFMIEFADVVTGSDVAAPKGRLSLDIATIPSDPSMDPVPIRNSALAFHWTMLETGLEVVAYLG